MNRFLWQSFPLLIFIIVFSSQDARADDRPYWGFQAGYVDGSLEASDDSLGHKAGFELGAQLDYSLSSWFSLQTEFRFVQTGFSFVTESGSTGGASLYYLEVPLSAKFKLPVSDTFWPYLYLGAYAALKTGSSGSTGQGDPNGEPISGELNFSLDQVQTWDAGIQVGIGVDYQLDPNTRLSFTFERRASMIDMTPNSTLGPCSSNYIVGVGFGL